MDVRTTFFVFVCATLIIMNVSAKDHHQITLNTYICEVLDFTIVYNYTCKLTKSWTTTNRTTILRSTELNFKPGIKVYSFNLNLRLYRKFGNVFRPYLIDIEQDLCALLGKDRKSKNNSLLRKLLNLEAITKFGNFYEPCPFSGKRYERNVTADHVNIALSGEYKLDVTAFTTIHGIRKNMTFTQIFGEVRLINS